MAKMAFVFPGQGAQYVGMGEEIAKEYPVASEVFKAADEALGYKISEICFKGPEEKLKQTAYTQPAILTASIACYKVLEQMGIYPDFVAGHSLGEYTSIVVAGGLKFEEALKLVSKRGQYMEEAVPDGEGTMAAVIGLDFEGVKKLCEESSDAGIVEPANLNCPGQVVIAGETKAVKKVVQLAPERGAKKAVLLKVSGPFHSSLMAPAAEKLADELNHFSFNDPEIPVVINFSGEIATTGEELKKGLKKQVNNPVLWDKSIRTLLNKGVVTFVEVGPGRVLSGLIRKINRKVNIYNVENVETLNKTIDKMGEKNNVS